MADNEINIDIKVATENATKAIEELTRTLKKLKKEMPKWWQFWLWMPLINITRKK